MVQLVQELRERAILNGSLEELLCWVFLEEALNKYISVLDVILVKFIKAFAQLGFDLGIKREINIIFSIFKPEGLVS